MTVAPTRGNGRSIEDVWAARIARSGGAIPGSRIVRVERLPAQGQLPHAA
ncbi:hypothetical protein OG604_48170 [Streptomyces sp. NBC_01231]|nr:hypothetical protein OG604_48170 [Streptomyces sp. NBC_01231]